MKRLISPIFLSILMLFSISSTAFAAENTPPAVVAKSAVTIDADTGEIIYAKDIDAKVYPASTTKLITAMLLTEAKKPTDELSYTQSAAAQPAFSLKLNVHDLKVGEKITADNAMKGLLIYSANDIAYMIAGNVINKPDASVADTTNEFSALMNKKAQQLGMKNTHFVTPNGLHDPNHYTTAYDMSILGKNAFANKWILDTVKLKNTVVETVDGIKLPVENRNKLILDNQPVYDSTCIGGKTGYTDEAGKCLVSLFNRNGKKIISVVMKSAYDKDDTQVFKDTLTAVNWSYKQIQTPLFKGGDTYKTVTVSYKPLKFFGPVKTVKVPLILKENINYYKNTINDNEKKLTDNVQNLDAWKLNTSAAVGNVTLTERGVTKQYKLYSELSTGSIMKSSTGLYVGIAVAAVVAIALLITLLVKIKSLFRSDKRRYNKKGW
ncbi:MAG: D-alanyl-D-alanine carboxypeptidase family protein [Bacillota bacterium]|nr:D-alanyl-D-alanine carboxypeptidase family protein [Bacillota bacterium]